MKTTLTGVHVLTGTPSLVAGLNFHRFCLRSHLFDTQRADQPVRFPFIITAHMFATNQRDPITETLPV